MTFANSLDPDQAQHVVGPDLDPNCLTLWWYFFEKVDFEKNQHTTKKFAKLLSRHAFVVFKINLIKKFLSETQTVWI